MIKINRSKPIGQEPFWVVRKEDETTNRCQGIYIGHKAKDALEAAIAAGITKEEALAQYNSVMSRVKQDEIDDDI